MRTNTLLLFFFLAYCSCTNKDENKSFNEESRQEKEVFFPVTEYLKGQIAEIKAKGITPLRYIKKGNQTDSSWLNMNQLNDSFSDFLLPEIDSVKLANYYTGKRFFDQTLNEITLTYEANQTNTSGLVWQGWNVYINPETGNVDRIYMMKRISDKQTAQLTWLPYKNCKLVIITTNGDSSFVDSEIKTKWDY